MADARRGRRGCTCFGGCGRRGRGRGTRRRRARGRRRCGRRTSCGRRDTRIGARWNRCSRWGHGLCGSGRNLGGLGGRRRRGRRGGALDGRLGRAGGGGCGGRSGRRGCRRRRSTRDQAWVTGLVRDPLCGRGPIGRGGLLGRRCLLGGGLLGGRGLFGLNRAAQALGVGLATDAVRLGVLNGRRVALDPNSKREGQVKPFFVAEA